MPSGINILRSQVLHQAAQGLRGMKCCNKGCMHSSLSLDQHTAQSHMADAGCLLVNRLMDDLIE